MRTFLPLYSLYRIYRDKEDHPNTNVVPPMMIPTVVDADIIDIAPASTGASVDSEAPGISVGPEELETGSSIATGASVGAGASVTGVTVTTLRAVCIAIEDIYLMHL